MGSTQPSVETDRIEELLKSAEHSIKESSLQDAHNALREASSIAPDDARIIRALDDLKDEESGRGIVGLCERWMHSRNDDDGEHALDYIHKHSLSNEWASQAMAVMTRYSGDEDMADQITKELLKFSGAQKYLALQMKESPTVTYRNIFERGDDSINSLNSILLDPKVWDTEKDRIAAERDVFQLALAQMMRAGEDHPERAMRSISRMLAVEHSHLKGLIDADGFDIILVHLDLRLSESLRREATIATSKLFELAPESAETLIAQFVIDRIKRPTADSLIISFSAAAAVFPMAPSAAEKLFISDGFLPTLVRLVQKYKSARLEQAALNLLDIACISKVAREGIHEYCQEWIQDFAENLKEQKKSMQARKILMKLKSDSKEDWEQQAKSFSRLIVDLSKASKLEKPSSIEQVKDALEGLAMCALKTAAVRNSCGNDRSLLTALSQAIDVQKYTFSALQTVAYITSYRPRMSDEQKKMQQLQAYAANSKIPPPDPLDDDVHITRRCKNVIDAQIVPAIVKAMPKATHLSAALAVQILNALSFEKKHRGSLAQQGAVRILVQLWDGARLYSNADEKIATQIPACNAVARILISTDPTVYFTGEARKEQILPSCAKMLTQLIDHEPDSDGPRDWLPTFEALLALTNLASLDDMAFKETIAKDNFTKLEDLLLSHNYNIRMRATELLTNLSYTNTVLEKFSTDERAKQRLGIVLALVTAAEKSTRLAALGSLCMMTEASEPVSRAFTQHERSKAMLTRVLDPPAEDVELAEPVGDDEQYRMCYLVRTLAGSGKADLQDFVKVWAGSPGVAGKAALLVVKTRNQETREILTGVVLKDVELSEEEKRDVIARMRAMGLGT